MAINKSVSKPNVRNIAQIAFRVGRLFRSILISHSTSTEWHRETRWRRSTEILLIKSRTRKISRTRAEWEKNHLVHQLGMSIRWRGENLLWFYAVINSFRIISIQWAQEQVTTRTKRWFYGILSNEVGRGERNCIYTKIHFEIVSEGSSGRQVAR